MITIIMPTLDASATIRRALDSLLIQSFQQWELIVIDGGSKDDTVEMVKEKVLDARVVAMPGGSIYDSINVGLFGALGEWIYIMGADDELASETILHEVWHQLRHERYKKFVYGRCIARGSYRWMQDGKPFGEELSREDLMTRGICQQSTFYHRNLFKHLGLFNPKYKLYADWDMAIRAFDANEAKYIDDIICIYNTMGRSSRERDEAFLELLRNLN